MPIRDGANIGAVIDTVPVVDDLGQVVRPIGPMDVNVLSGAGSPKQPGVGTVVGVANSVTSVVILAANALRLGCSIYNNSNRTLYLRFSAGAATTSNWSVKLEKDALYEFATPIFTGIINGIWSAAGSGEARVTEFTEV